MRGGKEQEKRKKEREMWDELLLRSSRKEMYELPTSRTVWLLVQIRKKWKKLTEGVRKQFLPTQPDVKQMLYGYSILNMFMCQQLRTDA